VVGLTGGRRARWPEYSDEDQHCNLNRADRLPLAGPNSY